LSKQSLETIYVHLNLQKNMFIYRVK